MIVMIKKLNIKDINQKFINSIAFIYVAHPGCLGTDGKVEFILTNNNSYSCNIVYKQEEDYLDYLTLREKLSIYNFDFDINSSFKEYEDVYLGGCGNSLYVNSKYILMFYRFAYGMTPSQVFRKWREFVSYILCIKKSEN